MKKGEKGEWIVRMKCEVTKEVVCENCTEQEAREEPWEHAISEEELTQIDWKVTQVERND